MARASSYSGEYFALREDLVDSPLWGDWIAMRLYFLLARWSQRARPLGTVRFSYGMAERALAGTVGNRNEAPRRDSIRRALKALADAGLIHVPQAPWGSAGGKGRKAARGQAAAGQRGGIVVKVPNVGTSRAKAARTARGSPTPKARGSATGKAARPAPQGVPPSGEREPARAHEGARASEAAAAAQPSAPPCAECLLSGPPSLGQVGPNPAAYGPGTPGAAAGHDRPLCAVHAYGGAATRSRAPGVGAGNGIGKERAEVEQALVDASANVREQKLNGKDRTLRSGSRYLDEIRFRDPERWEALEREVGNAPTPGALLRVAAPDRFDKVAGFIAGRWPTLRNRDAYVRSALADQLRQMVEDLGA